MTFEDYEQASPAEKHLNKKLKKVTDLPLLVLNCSFCTKVCEMHKQFQLSWQLWRLYQSLLCYSSFQAFICGVISHIF